MEENDLSSILTGKEGERMSLRIKAECEKGKKGK